MPHDGCMVCYECDSRFTVFNCRHHCQKCGRVFCVKCTANLVHYVTASRYEARPSSPPTCSPPLSTASFASTKSSGVDNSSISTIVSFTSSGRAYRQASYGHAPSSRQSVQLETSSNEKVVLTSETNMDSSMGKGDHSPTKIGACLNRSDDDADDYQWDSEDQRNHNSDDFYGPLEFDESGDRCGSNEVCPAEGNNGIQDIGTHASDSRNFHSSLVVGKVEEQGIMNNVECDTSSIYGVDTTDTEPMDFENNQQLWLPPEPENEDDAREAATFEEEDAAAAGERHYLHSLNSLGSGEHRSRDRSSEEHKKAIKNVVDGHFRALVSQLLQVENICITEEDEKENWLDIITSLSWEAASILKPDTSSGGGMDPGLYVKVKCLACGHRSDSMVVKGVVCKKNVANRRMLSKIERPCFLILGGALEYQRVTNLLSSFDTLLQQEMDHLKMAVAKIDSYQPDVLLVEKSVSRFAQDYLLAKNISLVMNIKRPLLERIARCTGAQIVPSIDLLSSPKLGYCDIFHVEKFLEDHGSADQGERKQIKTLMFFEGCPKPLGCTILLKGSSGDELKKVKHVLQYGVFAAYHLALETCFLADEGAFLPELPLKSPITDVLPGKSDHNIGIENFNETRLVTQPDSFEDNASQAFNSTTTPISASVDMHDLSIDKGNLMNNIDGEHTAATFIPLSPSETAPSSFVAYSTCHSGKENKAELSKEDETGYMEKSNETSPHYPALRSSYLDEKDSFEGGRKMDGDLQTDSTKISGSLHGFSNLGTSYQDDPRDDVKQEVQQSSSDHQSILVSVSSRCVWKGTVCERSHLFRYKYYGNFDRPLGRYLRDHLLDQNYRCHSCEMPSEAHIYCYTHRQGSLTISVRKLQGIHLPGEHDGKIWMWHRCLRCPRANGLPPATQRIVMSDAAWGLSFGKFLELSFSNHAAASRVAICGHSLHRDCLRFYGSGEMIACFRYAPIYIHSVYLPPSMLNFNCQHQEWVQDEVDKVRTTACDLFAQAQKSLYQLEEKISNADSQDGNMKVLESRRNIIELEEILLKEQEDFEETFQVVAKKEGMNAQPFFDILEINKLQKQLLLQSYIWDIRIRLAAGSFRNPSDLLNSLLTRHKEDVALRDQRSFTSLETFVSSATETLNESGIKDEHYQYKQTNSNQQKLDMEHDKNAKVLSSSTSVSNQFDSKNCDLSLLQVLSDGQFPIMVDLSETLEAKWSGENGPNMADPSKLKSIALDEAESALLASENFEESTHTDLNSIFASKMPTKSGDCTENLAVLTKTPFSDLYASLNKNLDSALSEYHPEYIFLIKKLMQKGWVKLLIPHGVYDTVIPIYDDEPTSVISYALASADYDYQMSDEPENFSRNFSIPFSVQDSGKFSIFQSLEDIAFESFRSLGSFEDISSSFTASKSSLILDPLTSTKSMHIRVSFAMRYNVTCYYAKQFDALRRTCCPSEIDFIRSLSRCKKWGAQGGKSNVFFAKSLDDRFIIKQVTKTELESFIKFANEYFKYILQSISTGSPTCLAKILGIYQVAIKSSKGGKESRIDILVMENLLFGRSVKWLYDLKGSTRSRYNADSSGNNKVLLDQNLIEAMPTSPIFVGNKAKRLLERAVWNDTSFLASIDVMDYSLLVGIDENKHELVLGIIDFMRQYTWDKHLETWVKTSGILGGTKDASPTVISPKQYKKRFRKAMAAYFLVVPDQWSPPAIVPSRSQSDLGQDDQLGDSLNS